MAAPDRVTDFSQKNGDRIDLTIIDAKLGGSDGAFTFVGKSASHAGELHYSYAHGITTLPAISMVIRWPT